MKPHWIAAPLCLVAGILIGRTAGPSAEPAESAKREAPRVSERLRGGRESRPASELGRLREDIRRASPEQLPGLLKRSLEYPDLFERNKLALECLQGMDGRNWREMYGQFAQVTRETGMTHDYEWRLALMLAGRSGGREAVDYFRQSGGGDQLREAVWGWAQVQPAAALHWLDEAAADNPKLRRQLLTVVVGGAVQLDGAGAAKMLEALPLSDRLSCVGDFGWNLVKRDGIDAAVEWAVETKRQTPEGEAAYASGVINDVSQRIFEMCQNVGGGRGAAVRMARLIEADDSQLRQLPKLISALKGGEAFEFLADLSVSPALAGDDARAQWQAQVARLVGKRPDVAASWLQEHPDDPLAATLRELGR